MVSGDGVQGYSAIDVRIKLCALWTSILFIFAYVDIFASFRADIVTGVVSGKIAGFQVDQVFLVLTTLYVVVPSLMIFLSLVLRPAVGRWANVVLAVLYALSIVGSAVGETWWYYYLGSAVECALLAAIVWYAWTWRTHLVGVQGGQGRQGRQGQQGRQV